MIYIELNKQSFNKISGFSKTKPFGGEFLKITEKQAKGLLEKSVNNEMSYLTYSKDGEKGKPVWKNNYLDGGIFGYDSFTAALVLEATTNLEEAQKDLGCLIRAEEVHEKLKKYWTK